MRGTRRGLLLLGLAGLLVLGHLATSLAGFGDHVGAIAGMPAGDDSLWFAAAHIGGYLAALVFAPILAIAGAITLPLEALTRRRA